MNTVPGECLGYSILRHGFVYSFTCEQCRRRFLETTPEVSAPSLCQRCYTGMDEENRRIREREKRRGHEETT